MRTSAPGLSLAVQTGPAAEPVTRAEAKVHAKIDTNDEDTYVDGLVSSARQLVEELTGRVLITQTWTATLDDWPSANPMHDWWNGVRELPITTALSADRVQIPKAPFRTVSKVELIDEDNTATEIATTVWYSGVKHGTGELMLRRGQVWPATLRDFGGIRITFTVGYGANPSDVPFALRQAVMMLVAHWYETREPSLERGGKVPFTVDALLAPYRVLR